MKAERTLFNKRGPRTSEIHGYEAPEVLAIDISAGNIPYPEWWMKKTRSWLLPEAQKDISGFV